MIERRDSVGIQDGADKNDALPTEMSEAEHRVRTRLIHGVGNSERWDFSHHVVPPMTSSATFRLDSVERGAQGFVDFAHEGNTPHCHTPIYIYDRLDEPTRGMLEDNLALAERGDMGLCFASGMAAISAVFGTLVKSGEHIIAHDVLYGCTYSLVQNWMPRLNIRCDLADLRRPEIIARCATRDTRVVYFETPVNPDLTMIDIAGVASVVAELNESRTEDEKIRVVVDNTFASPFCQRPLELGADIVCLSLTKAIGGFGTDIGGAVVGPQWLHDSLIHYRKDFGGTLSPKAAWGTLVYGLPSLATRMANYQKSAAHIAQFLENHPKVSEVHYPGLKSFPQSELAQRQMRDDSGKFAPGSMLYFVLNDKTGDGQPARQLVNYLADHSYCITLAVSLGQIKTLIECPYWMTHSAMSVEAKRAHDLAPGGCRLSVGLEDWHDIVADLDAALDRI